MREYGLTILVAAAVTYLLTPLVRRFAIAVGAMHVGRARDVHTEPVPLVGGLAMYLGLAAALLVASRLTHLSTVFMGTRVASGLLLAGGVVVVLGFVDDRWGLGAITKLAGQVVAGVLLVWSGASVGWLPIPGQGTLSLTLNQQTVLTILLVVVTINAVNFIDGLDGLAAGIVGIGAAAFFLYYYTLTKRLGLDEQTGPALASAILAGVCLGFLPHNFHPARIFMGDTGSMLLGLLLAYVPISSLASLDPNTLSSPSAYSSGTVNRFPEILPLLVPAMIMLIPYADLLLAVVRRTRAGQSPFSADKKHLQHRLLAIGHSHRTSVLIMYLWAALFAGTVVLLSIIRTKLLILGLVTLAGVLILLLASMPRLRPWNRRGQLRLAAHVAGPVPSDVPVPAGAGAGVPLSAGVPSGVAVASGAGVASGVGVAPDGSLPSGRPVPSGPVPSGPVPSGGPGASAHSIPPSAPAAAGTAARSRRRADPGASLDRELPVDGGLAADPDAGVDRAAPARPPGFGDLGSVEPERGDVTYEDPLRGAPERGDVAYGDPLRGDRRREDVSYGDPLPGPGSPAAPSDGGWAPDPVGGPEPGQWYPDRTDPARTDPGPTDPGGQDSGQWYSGRPEPSQGDSGSRESRPRDAGTRQAGPQGAGLEDASLPGPSLPDPRTQDVTPRHAGPQDIDPLTSDLARSQPPRPAQVRPDANEYSEGDESPLLPWRLH